EVGVAIGKTREHQTALEINDPGFGTDERFQFAIVANGKNVVVFDRNGLSTNVRWFNRIDPAVLQQ
ncbi:MAG: hypothetical protein OEW09_13465, partial [Anaerolineae bacterium]|nr:hypothetical protein [Anaerolineae bacterium]